MAPNIDSECIQEFQNNEEFINERFTALKRRCKKIKQKMQMKAFKHENPSIVGKETTSQNKQRLMRLVNELDRLSNSQVSNYDALENTSKEL